MEQIRLHEKAQILFNNQVYSYTEIRKQMDIYKSALSGIQSAAVAIDRSAELLILLMAMLESGISFLPLEHQMAKERLNYMLQDSQVEVIIINAKYKEKFEYTHIKVLEDMTIGDIPISTVCGGERIAYILYTSGSTGHPKGVAIPRSALENFIEGVSKVIPFLSGKRIACLTTVSFDIFLLESIMALCKGLTVVLANDEEQRNPRRIAQLLTENKVDMLQMTPSMMQLLINHNETLECLQNIQEIMLGGEVLPLDMLKRLQQHTKARVYNMYGPTETTIWSCIADLTKSRNINIGFPIQNTDVYILDENHQIVPDGGAGEIAIAGAGLAHGYINLKTLTEEKFVQLAETGKRVYLTGDLGKVLPDKALQYIGRIDNQIKVRGHRIEPEEIESVLNAHNSIKQSIVAIVNDERTSTLVAFYIGDGNINKQELKDELGQKLPDYMIPACFIQVSDFPLTINGKINRKQLLSEYLSPQTVKQDINAAGTSETASKIIALIYDMVSHKYKGISGETTLAELGIDSITFIKLVVQLEEMFEFEFDDQMLLFTAYPNIQSMIDYVETKQ